MLTARVLLALGVAAGTPLLESIQTNNYTWFAQLIDSGEDLNVEALWNFTIPGYGNLGTSYGEMPYFISMSMGPIYLAANLAGRSEFLARLIAEGVDFQLAQTVGYFSTPLHLACVSCDAENVRVLVEAGALLEVVDRTVHTPLLTSATHCLVPGPMAILLAAGANLTRVDPAGRGVLHLAAYRGGLLTTELFLAAGADPRAVNNFGKTPYDYAILFGHPETAAMLDAAYPPPQSAPPAPAPPAPPAQLLTAFDAPPSSPPTNARLVGISVGVVGAVLVVSVLAGIFCCRRWRQKPTLRRTAKGKGECSPLYIYMHIYPYLFYVYIYI